MQNRRPGILGQLVSFVIAVVAWGAMAPGTLAGTSPSRGAPPDYGYQFVTIGAVGNRATIPTEVPMGSSLQIGAVGYEYRISTTEVSGRDWFEFVQAYAPYVGTAFANPAFTSGAVIFRGFGVGGVPTYTMDPIYNDRALDFGWRYAARYANWLHNDKSITPAAFENGAYDTSTFTSNPDGTVNDQLAHNPSARFWIPTQNEWVKATYYDPNRYGVGQEGYWQHPGGQDTPLQGGLPGQPGAQTPAPVQGPALYPDVGSYPDVNSPWGLLDTSGGAAEWTETGFNVFGGRRLRYGSYTGVGENYMYLDRIDRLTYEFSASGAPAGLRLASAVPSPSGALAFVIGTMVMYRRKR